jgi:hypothetical protein
MIIITHQVLILCPVELINHPSGGSEWVELFVQEMMNASDMDDARSHASRAFEVLEKSITSRVSPESMQNVQKVFIFRLL